MSVAFASTAASVATRPDRPITVAGPGGAVVASAWAVRLAAVGSASAASARASPSTIRSFSSLCRAQ